LTLETQISTPLGQVPIGTLRNGDIVYSVNPWTLRIEPSEIFNYFTATSDVFRITTAGGFEITATSDHPFLKGSRWVNVDELEVGDPMTVMGMGVGVGVGVGVPRPIESITHIGKRLVADFTTVSENHSFIANGFVTHNCGLMQVVISCLEGGFIN
jgi:intein/homing endonuclease